jgi:hypothetical protein
MNGSVKTGIVILASNFLARCAGGSPGKSKNLVKSSFSIALPIRGLPKTSRSKRSLWMMSLIW